MNSSATKPWVVVVDGGTVDEYQDDEFSSFTLACGRAGQIEREEGRRADVMKRDAGGGLTTEY
jgi:hypothetical protein